MAKNKKMIVTHSNYTIKRKHKTLNDKNVLFERDFMITNNGNTWSGDGSPYGISSFKMVTNTNNGVSHKYNNGGWVKTSACNDEINNYGDIWTLKCIPNINTKNEENNIVIIPTSNSLLNYVYYGSCVDLLKNSINHIIKTFPAELCFTDIKDEINGLYEIYNPFLINLHSQIVTMDNDNNLRFFYQNFEKYVIINEKENKINIKSFLIENFKNLKCAENYDKICNIKIIDINNKVYNIYCYYINKEYKYYTDEIIDIRIRPNEFFIKDFFEKLDNFQKNMLNTDSYPLYTMLLDFPHETENGIETYKKRFTWPISEVYWKSNIGGWNIDISSSDYEAYVKDLLELSSFYDERTTNNLWRSMVHDSIKNMDYAFKNDKQEDDEYEMGVSRVETLIKCYSKQFDEIKLFIDNIKNCNNVVYNSNNNIPSYFLSDKLEMSGWEVSNLDVVLNSNTTVENIYEGINKSYSVSETNINFMKYLQINSKNILSHKGTRHGIEMLLGLFGLKSYDSDKKNYDYKIKEYVHTLVGNSKVDVNKIKYYNSLKENFENTFSSFEVNNTNPLQGLPLREVAFINENGNEDTYLIPWFDKYQKLDGGMYFQMYGGWGKNFFKDIDNINGIKDDLKSTKNFEIYDETIKNLIAVKKIEDLKFISNERIHNGCIAYVYDINNFDDVYNNDSISQITLNGDNGTLKASNYFIIDNKNNSYTIGSYLQDNTIIYGWENITHKDIDENSDRGVKVKLSESVIENHKGNNPHGGFGKYDDGETYIDYFKQFFKFSIENNNFKDLSYTCENGLLKEEIYDFGFDIVLQEDNVKTWYFTDTSNKNEKLVELNRLENISEGDVYYNGVIYKNIENKNYYYEPKDLKNVEVGKNNDFTFFETQLETFNFESTPKNDESESNSIINNKRLIIEFNNGLTNDSLFPSFLQYCILPYLKQIIPSSTIWEIKLEGDYAIYSNRKFAEPVLK